MFTGMPSAASVWVAARPSTMVGIFTTMFGAISASLRPSATISSRVMATDSAETGQSGPTMSQMRFMWLWKSSSLPPILAYSDGLVVTPASAPQLAASSISAKSAVSRKNFTLIPPYIYGLLPALRTERALMGSGNLMMGRVSFEKIKLGAE